VRKILLVLLSLVALSVTGYGYLKNHTSALSTTTIATSTTTTTTPAPPTICNGLNCATWKVADSWAGQAPMVMTTVFTPFTSEPAVHAYVAWIKSSAIDIALYPGYKGPGPSALARGPEMVPLTARTRLLATFNSGFYESDSAAGFFTNNTLYYPMVRGLATLVRYKSGVVDIKAWDGGKRPGPDILMARQNLSLLVDNSLPTAKASNNVLWGLTLHGVAAVWRTALGVDEQGNLMYVAAPAQTSQSLATILCKLHVVRAMQLDINPEWPIFVTYANRGATGPALFVPNTNQISARFLYPSTKDFFAVFLSKSAGESQPW